MLSQYRSGGKPPLTVENCKVGAQIGTSLMLCGHCYTPRMLLGYVYREQYEAE